MFCKSPLRRTVEGALPLLFLATFIALPQDAIAEDWLVDDDRDNLFIQDLIPGTLRWAVDSAAAGDRVVISSSLSNSADDPVRIELHRPLTPFEKSLTIDGSDDGVGGLIVRVRLDEVESQREICDGDPTSDAPNFILTVCDVELKLIDAGFEGGGPVLLNTDDADLIYSTRDYDFEYPNNIVGGGDIVAAGAATVTLSGLSDFALDDSADNPNHGAGTTRVIGGTLIGDVLSLVGDILVCGPGDPITAGSECAGDPEDREPADGRLTSLLIFSADKNQEFGKADENTVQRTRGSGAVAKDGTGTLTFGGTMEHTGGTWIREGALQADATALGGSIHVCSLDEEDTNSDCVPDGQDGSSSPSTKLIINQETSGQLKDSVDFSGYGTIEKTGAGTLTITANNVSDEMDNEFFGPFTVKAGGLDLSTDALLHTGALTMEESTTLSGTDAGVDAESVSIQGAQLSGAGSSGILITSGDSISFEGDNSFTGSVVNLQASDSIRILSGESLLENGVQLTLGQALDVRSGATFGGTGTAMGDLDISGTLQISTLSEPGDTAAFLAGDVEILAGATFSTKIDPDNQRATKLANLATNTIVIEDGATVEVAFASDLVDDEALEAVGQDYRIAETATGNLSITVANVDVSSQTKAAGHTLSLATNEDCAGVDCLNLDLSVSLVPLEPYGETSNQRAVAAQVNAAGDGACEDADDGGGLGPVICDPTDTGRFYYDLLFRTPESDLPSVFDQLTGAGLSAFSDVRLAANTRYNRSISRRFDLEKKISNGDGLALQRGFGGSSNSTFAILGSSALPEISASGAPILPQRGGMGRHPGKGGWTSWGDLHGVFASFDADRASDDLDYRIYGPIFGIDYGISDLITIGGTFGYQRGEFQTNLDQTKGTENTYSVGLYMGALGDHGYLTAAGRFAYSQMLSRRHIEYGGNSSTAQSEIAHGDFNGMEYALFVEGAWGFDVSKSITIQPVASLSYDHLEQDAFKEDDAGILDLSVDEQKLDVVETFIGVRTGFLGVAADISYLHPQLRVGWERTWTGNDRTLDMKMPGLEDSGSFEIEGIRLPKDRAVIGISSETGLTETFNLFLEYDARIASGFLENSVALGFRATW